MIETVSIAASRPYEVKLGRGLLAHAGEFIAAVTTARRCVLVSDTNVAPRYAEPVCLSLQNAGFAVHTVILPAGEQYKTLTTLGELLSSFARYALTRTDLVVALGGGVIGDMAGFAAAVYQRGIDFVLLPTTLLAACDASVGGKTAVDIPEGKNLAGAFHQPRLVLCDTEVIAALPHALFQEGLAEIAKHALIADKILYQRLMGETPFSDLTEIIRRNIEIKAAVVSADEHEHGQRKLLNFGHTLGHAVEALSGYRISHGNAVAMGMAMVSRAAYRMGYSTADTTDAVLTLLTHLGLPVDCPYSAAELFSAAVADKKRTGDKIDIIYLHDIGQAVMRRLSLEELRCFTEAAR